jgi:hypothetical protein
LSELELYTRIVVLIERKQVIRPMVAAALLSLCCGVSVAQSTGVGPEVRRAAQLGADHTGVLTQYIRENSTNLAAENPDQIRRNRTALLEPLADVQASPAFRLKYSELLMPVIGPLATNTSDIVVINALVLAGDLATAQSTELLKSAAASEKPAIRYQAAFGMRRTFEALATMPTMTMRGDQVEDAVKSIAGRIGNESDALVLDGLVSAAIQATNIPSLRSSALTSLSSAVGARAKATNTDSAALAPVMLRAGVGVRDALANTTTGQLASDAVKSAAELGGHLIAFCVKSVENKSIPMVQRGQSDYAGRETFAQIAMTAENIVLLAASLQGASGVEGKQIGEKLKAGTANGDAAFVVDAQGIVGAAGMLSKPPFAFAPGTFIQK